jgi:hypothetical protein
VFVNSVGAEADAGVEEPLRGVWREHFEILGN